ncbi:hypothetical protein ACIRRA_14485 [Nocardia sp. NPDC101769]|uniref:hypothetical protein n=1 Tax=Nocardia sp. NPDC101769 TaxID=3364333 RepID=UPI00382D2AF8
MAGPAVRHRDRVNARLDLPTIPPAVLIGVAEIGRRDGCDVESWFAGTGLDPDGLVAVDSAKVAGSRGSGRRSCSRSAISWPGAVAREVGYSDIREFRRAYVRWTGHSPSSARREAE